MGAVAVMRALLLACLWVPALAATLPAGPPGSDTPPLGDEADFRLTGADAANRCFEQTGFALRQVERRHGGTLRVGTPDAPMACTLRKISEQPYLPLHRSPVDLGADLRALLANPRAAPFSPSVDVAMLARKWRSDDLADRVAQLETGAFNFTQEVVLAEAQLVHLDRARYLHGVLGPQLESLEALLKSGTVFPTAASLVSKLWPHQACLATVKRVGDTQAQALERFLAGRRAYVATPPIFNALAFRERYLEFVDAAMSYKMGANWAEWYRLSEDYFPASSCGHLASEDLLLPFQAHFAQKSEVPGSQSLTAYRQLLEVLSILSDLKRHLDSERVDRLADRQRAAEFLLDRADEVLIDVTRVDAEAQAALVKAASDLSQSVGSAAKRAGLSTAVATAETQEALASGLLSQAKAEEMLAAAAVSDAQTQVRRLTALLADARAARVAVELRCGGIPYDSCQDAAAKADFDRERYEASERSLSANSALSKATAALKTARATHEQAQTRRASVQDQQDQAWQTLRRAQAALAVQTNEPVADLAALDARRSAASVTAERWGRLYAKVAAARTFAMARVPKR